MENKLDRAERSAGDVLVDLEKELYLFCVVKLLVLFLVIWDDAVLLSPCISVLSFLLKKPNFHLLHVC